MVLFTVGIPLLLAIITVVIGIIWILTQLAGITANPFLMTFLIIVAVIVLEVKTELLSKFLKLFKK